MLKIMDLSEQELQELLDQPMSDEEAEALRQINESDRWLLHDALECMEENDPSSCIWEPIDLSEK
ncbi:MAG: hypothetical protein NTX82_02020 [Candidatus Parcubacteria bacterium]|nr:hypothetical protein [Candidatus Parcubacteria bacterium]